jgi:hypothetical protein
MQGVTGSNPVPPTQMQTLKAPPLKAVFDLYRQQMKKGLFIGGDSNSFSRRQE